MLDICGEEAQLRYALDVVLLLQCLLQGTHPARSSLRVLPHLSHKTASEKVLRRLEALGVSSLPQVNMQRRSEVYIDEKAYISETILSIDVRIRRDISIRIKRERYLFAGIYACVYLCIVV